MAKMNWERARREYREAVRHVEPQPPDPIYAFIVQPDSRRAPKSDYKYGSLTREEIRRGEAQLGSNLRRDARAAGVSKGILRQKRIAAYRAGWMVPEILSGKAFDVGLKVRQRAGEAVRPSRTVRERKRVSTKAARTPLPASQLEALKVRARASKKSLQEVAAEATIVRPSKK